MSSKDRCIKCNRAVKDGVICSMCECLIHVKCAGLTDEVSNLFAVVKNLKWLCDGCLKIADDFKGFTKIVSDNHNELSAEVKKIIESNALMSKLLDDMNELMSVRVDRTAECVAAENLLGEKIESFKSEINDTWASVVGREIKKNIQVVNDGVKTEIKKTFSSADEIKERENNIVLFNLGETDTVSDDKNIVMSIIKTLSGDLIKENNIVKIMRQGRRGMGPGHIRPIVVKFDNLSNKTLLFNNLFKIKTLKDNLSNIKIGHDLTREQREEFNKLLEESKTLEANDSDGFLYRVRGSIGRWKIVKFLKKKSE